MDGILEKPTSKLENAIKVLMKESTQESKLIIMYTCKYLDQIIIDDLFTWNPRRKGFLARQIGRYLQG